MLDGPFLFYFSSAVKWGEYSLLIIDGLVFPENSFQNLYREQISKRTEDKTLSEDHGSADQLPFG